MPVLMDKDAAPRNKQRHLSRFLDLLDMHGRAEEETLYRCLMRNPSKEARLEGLGGQDEHDIAYQLGQELRQLNFEFAWSESIDAKAKVVASLMANHIKEEERKMFSIAQNDIETDELRALTDEYIEKCKYYLDVAMNTPKNSFLDTSTISH